MATPVEEEIILGSTTSAECGYVFPTAVKYVEQPKPKMTDGLPLEASVKNKKRSRISSSIEAAKKIRSSFSPLVASSTKNTEIRLPTTGNFNGSQIFFQSPVMTPKKKTISASPGSTKASKQLKESPLSDGDVSMQLHGNPLPAEHSDSGQKSQNHSVVVGKKDIGQALKIGGSPVLKKRLNSKTGQMKDLKKRMSLQIQRNKELMENNAGAMERSMTNRKQDVSQLHGVSLIIEKQKAEIKKNELEKANLEREVTILQKKLKQSQETITKLFDLNKRVILVLKNREPEKQKMAAEKDVLAESRLMQKIAELESMITEINVQLTKRIQNQKLLAVETAKQLKLSRKEGITMKTLLDKKESINISLKKRIKELEAAQIELIKVTEECARELDAEKAKSLAEKEVQGLIVKIDQITINNGNVPDSQKS